MNKPHFFHLGSLAFLGIAAICGAITAYNDLAAGISICLLSGRAIGQELWEWERHKEKIRALQAQIDSTDFAQKFFRQ